jgi:hypothetical protein
VTASGVVGVLTLSWATQHAILRFLFERPAQLWIAPQHLPKIAHALQSAE